MCDGSCPNQTLCSGYFPFSKFLEVRKASGHCLPPRDSAKNPKRILSSLPESAADGRDLIGEVTLHFSL